MAPLVTVIVGGLFAYFGHMEQHGIQVVSDEWKISNLALISFHHSRLILSNWFISQVGHLNRGINPLSIDDFVFDSKYTSVLLKAGLVTAILGLSVRTNISI